MGEQILSNFMQDIVKEHNLADYEIKIEPISSGGANYTSTLFNVTLTKGDDVVDMFAKVAAVGEKMRSQAPKFYETERFVYTKLVKVYERLQKEHNVPQEHRLSFSKCYGCKPDLYEETVVLENLVKNGYQSYDRFKTFDWEYAKSAVSELAKMHALSFAYGVYHPKEFNQIVDDVKFEWDTSNEQMNAHFDIMVNKAADIINEANKEKFLRFFQSFEMHHYLELYKWSRRPVLGHGDYRPSNLMHKIREDGSVEIKIVDLQTLQGASPIVDLLYFIYAGSDEEFHTKYYEKLLDHYYTELEAAMKRLHLNPEDVYSKSDFFNELKQKQSFGLTMAVFLLPIITIDAEDAPKVDKEMEMTDFFIKKTSNLYAERLNGVVNHYVKLRVLK